MSESKAAKKNKKRKSKTTKNDEIVELSNQEMLTKLKLELDIAKTEKNHESAKILREQIWILGDAIAGVRTDVPEEDLNRILLSIGDKFNLNSNTAPSFQNKSLEKLNKDIIIDNKSHDNKSHDNKLHDIKSHDNKPLNENSRIFDDRKLKNLYKKLEQIKILKIKMNAGEKLEENQIQKIKTEPEITEEIKQIEEILSKLHLT